MGSAPNFACETKFGPDPIFLGVGGLRNSPFLHLRARAVLGLLPPLSVRLGASRWGPPCAAAGRLAAIVHFVVNQYTLGTANDATAYYSLAIVKVGTTLLEGTCGDKDGHLAIGTRRRGGPFALGLHPALHLR